MNVKLTPVKLKYEKMDYYHELLEAIICTDHKTIREILKLDVDLSITGEDGNTLLHESVEHSYSETTELFLLAGADVNQRNNYGQTPLGLGCFRKCYDEVELLLKFGAVIDNNDSTPLIWATRKDDMEFTELLLENGADPNSLLETWGYKFVLNYCINEMIELLLRYGAAFHPFLFKKDGWSYGLLDEIGWPSIPSFTIMCQRTIRINRLPIPSYISPMFMEPPLPEWEHERKRNELNRMK